VAGGILKLDVEKEVAEMGVCVQASKIGLTKIHEYPAGLPLVTRIPEIIGFRDRV
jgi:hypothetical protein